MLFRECTAGALTGLFNSNCQEPHIASTPFKKDAATGWYHRPETMNVPGYVIITGVKVLTCIGILKVRLEDAR